MAKVSICTFSISKYKLGKLNLVNAIGKPTQKKAKTRSQKVSNKKKISKMIL